MWRVGDDGLHSVCGCGTWAALFVDLFSNHAIPSQLTEVLSTHLPCIHHVITIHSPYIHHTFTIHSSHIHHIFIIYSSYIHHIITIDSPYIHNIITIQSPYINHKFTILHTFTIHPLHFHHSFTRHSCNYWVCLHFITNSACIPMLMMCAYLTSHQKFHSAWM